MSVVLADRIEELQRDRAHGASWMARRAVEALVDVAEESVADGEQLCARLLAAGRELAESRPSVGAIAGAVGRLLAAAHRNGHLEVADLRRLIDEEARALMDARRRAAASIAIQLRDRLTDATVLTHSASATVREALLHTPPEKVICTVSYPIEEGRAFAEKLRRSGLNAELVEDEDAPTRLDEISLFLVGADTVFRDGTLCNKIGTAVLADAAAAERVPTVVAAEVIKLAPINASDVPPPDAEALFDLTPAELIDEIVTEEGAHPIEEVPALVDRTPFLREGYALLRGGELGS